MKRRTTRSYSFLLGLARSPMGLAWGDDRKWSLTLLLSKCAWMGGCSCPSAPSKRAAPGGACRCRPAFQTFVGHGQIVFGQRARAIGTRVGQALWRSYRLCARASVVLAEAELAVGLALQAGQVEQQGRCLGGGLALSVTVACLPRTALAMACASAAVDQAVGLGLRGPRPSSNLGRTTWRGIHRPGRQRWRGFPSSRGSRTCGSFLRAPPPATAWAFCTRPTVVRKKPPSRELNAVMARVPLMPTSQSASDRLRAALARPAIC